MNKKEFLQEKYEEINRLKISIQDYPKESIDNILKSISNICDEINKHLEGKNNKKNIEINDNNSKTYEDNYDYNIEDNINNDVENKKKNKKSRGNENVFVKNFKKAAVHSLNSEQQRKFWKEQVWNKEVEVTRENRA